MKLFLRVMRTHVGDPPIPIYKISLENEKGTSPDTLTNEALPHYLRAIEAALAMTGGPRLGVLPVINSAQYSEPSGFLATMETGKITDVEALDEDGKIIKYAD